MTTYYKAARPDGRDFHSGTIDYGAALLSGEVIRHPAKRRRKNDASTYLSVSIAPADCTGLSWPCRLFRVEPVGRSTMADDLPNKRCCSALRVVEELPAHLALGPNGERAARFIADIAKVRSADWSEVVAAWVAAREAAWEAAWVAAWVAAREAAIALVARDLITPEQYATLVRPFVDAGLGELVA